MLTITMRFLQADDMRAAQIRSYLLAFIAWENQVQRSQWSQYCGIAGKLPPVTSASHVSNSLNPSCSAQSHSLLICLGEQ